MEIDMDAKVAAIDAWWTPYDQLWIVQLVDEKGAQIGNSFLYGHRSDAAAEIVDLMQQYPESQVFYPRSLRPSVRERIAKINSKK